MTKVNFKRISFFLTIVLSIFAALMCHFKEIKRSLVNQERDLQQFIKVLNKKSFKLTFEVSDLNSPAFLVYDLGAAKMLAAHNHHQLRAPASLAKIMTALLVIDNVPDLEQKIQVSAASLVAARRGNAALAGFRSGDLVSVRDLLYASLLPSGGEASYSLVEILGGQLKFQHLAREKASSLGLKNSIFLDPAGLDVVGQNTTPNDMLKLLRAALKYPDFKQIFTSSEKNLDLVKRQLLVKSTFFRRLESSGINNFKIIGAKTGTTDAAGLCLASLVRYNEREILVLTMGAPISHWPNPQPLHIADLKHILQNMRYLR